MMAVLISVHAQAEFKSKISDVTGTEFSFGAKMGFNVSSLSNSSLDGSKFSFHIGAIGEFRFNDYYGLQAEILYSRQGDYDKSGGDKTWWRVNYLNVPVLAKFYVWKGLSLETGPQLGVALNAKVKYKTGGTEIKADLDHLNTIDFTYVIGVNYDITDCLFVSTRYNLGLTNVFNKDKAEDKMKNRVFQISTGFKF